jgi:hypothetical protein
LDAEVLAALDNAFDFDDPEGQLEDDFVALASGPDDFPELSKYRVSITIPIFLLSL